MSNTRRSKILKPDTEIEMFHDTPIGRLRIVAENGAITVIAWTHGKESKSKTAAVRNDDPLLRKTVAEIDAYFAGTLKRFTVPVEPRGTDFQRRVWNRMRDIDFGETLSYGALARILDSGPRAIGQVCGKNPVLLAVPCHRVVAQQGLGGFGGKVQKPDQKTLLLDHEQKHLLPTKPARTNQRMTAAKSKDNFAGQ
jgi:methylated-DNA-[protein]-cysteine S-methyltransferase